MSTPTKSNPETKGHIRKIDAVVTGVILGGIIGSIYGIKKLKDREQESQTNLFDTHTPEAKAKSPRPWWKFWKKQ